MARRLKAKEVKSTEDAAAFCLCKRRLNHVFKSFTEKVISSYVLRNAQLFKQANVVLAISKMCVFTKKCEITKIAKSNVLPILRRYIFTYLGINI